jgi:hypothetical protein
MGSVQMNDVGGPIAEREPAPGSRRTASDERRPVGDLH